ncbi:carboxyl transferase domain-containing protein [Candidatus Epulonipiscium viviparus]|uniref:carboxyl transferase domain-containing protein n=1 Tax=Candidatus Epulonipiscium viviparus TaxID=420336 RepID=UPI002738045E|nr:carboxyl transferase domain-containing protein [Candidatus Epulopiscium viviparus]
MNNLVARNKVDALFDANSFVEIGALIKSKSTAFSLSCEETLTDGVVCGYGTIGGRLIYICIQEESVMGGAIGIMHSKKIAKTYEAAKKVGAPVIMYVSTTGARLEEGIETLEAYGQIYKVMASSKGVIPQIVVADGNAQGGASLLCGIADFVFMDEKKAKVFLSSVNTMDDKELTPDKIQTAKVHAANSGLANFVGDEAYISTNVANLLSFLPSNFLDKGNWQDCLDDLNRVDTNLNNFDFDNTEIKTVVTSIADDNNYLEISADYGASISAGFIKLNGTTIGVIANEEPGICLHGIKKANKFLDFLNDFSIPVLTVVNVSNFVSSETSEQQGIIEEFGKFTVKIANTKVPKVSLILGKAYGSAYVLMNSSHVGADLVLAWPTADITLMPTESAVKIMYAKELAAGEIDQDTLNEKVTAYAEQNAGVDAMAALGYIDEIVEPASSRKRLISAFEMLWSKGYDAK